MASAEPARRDAARLVALAEAVAEYAESQGQRELPRLARDTACRFEHTVAPTDRAAVALYRREVTGWLRAAHRSGSSGGPG